MDFSLFRYTLCKVSELANIAKTVPQRAKYISTEIQNELERNKFKMSKTMSNIITKEIVRQIGG